MRSRIKLCATVLSILALLYFIAPFSDRVDVLYETRYATETVIVEDMVNIVDQLNEEIVNFQFNNKSFYDLLKDINYFKGYKTEKTAEKELCEVPNLDIWEAKIKSLLKPTPVFNKCRKNTPLSYIKDNCLFIDNSIKKKFYLDSIKECRFAPVIRSAIAKDNYILGEFKNFTSGLPMIDECVQVRCYDKSNKLIYDYVHYIIQPVKNNINVKEASTNQKLNVLFLIFDSVSSSSFKRSLPKTLNLLKGYDNFFHFTKHHTVGQNTLPNLVPMLAGKSSEDLLGTSTFPPPFDDFPFIWKNFSESNYVTYLNEDWRNSMFNNDKFGFRKSPTDYYLKPFWLAAYNSLSSVPNKQNSNLNPCYYDKLYHHLSFDWLREFQQIYGKSNGPNTFGIVKSNEMSHDYLERLFWIDNDLKALMKELLTETFLNNTLLVLMGDHGHRFHPIRHTFSGKVEEKLPFFSMMVPRRLLNKNPFLSDVLKQNTQTLTTFYDVYETLRQLLIDQINIDPAQSIYLKDKLKRPSSGFSLFLPVPYRNCAQANIPEYLCSCQADAKVNLSKEDLDKAHNAAEFLVKYINDILLVNYRQICLPLELKRISDAQIVDKKLLKFSIIFETKPNGAIFDGIVTPNQTTKSFNLIGKISRVNLYGSTSKCMDSYFLKNYCYCKSNLNGTTTKV